MSSESIELTERELAVVRLVIEGLGNQEIADMVGVSKRTVQAHISNAMTKTGTSTRTRLAVECLRDGVVPLLPDKSHEKRGQDDDTTQKK
jgi:DNA-binding NarL/FixJ family response regulator